MPFLFQIQFTTSTFFWLLFCILLGIAYAFLLYRSQQRRLVISKVLFGLRATVVALISFLLFSPMIRFVGKTTEKPLIIVAQDNSASVSISRPANFNLSQYTTQIKSLEQNLSTNYDVKSVTFGADVKSGAVINYTDQLTNINSVFKYINDQYSNRNIGAVILASDGIYNQGGNPEFEAQNIKSPIYTIALGDTIPKKDILVANVNYNNIVYLNNDFQIEVNVEAFQSRGETSRLTVSSPSGTVFSKNILVTSNEYHLSVPVILSANKKGLQRFTVNLSPVSGELSKRNNSHTFFVEVIDGKNKVLILANSPHPDISAIKQAIETNKNYEVKSVLVHNYKTSDIDDAGLVIFHQLPSVSFDIKPLLKSLEHKSLWFIVGAQTNLSNFSALQSMLTINSAGAVEEATASINPAFYDFTLTEQTRGSIENFAPLIAPFGSYGVKGQASVLLNQRVGKLITDRPLLLFSKDPERKIAILAGEGIWRWRLENFQESGTHQAVDELLAKVVQYMVTKDDKRKFRVYPSKNTFAEGEHVLLNAELYNNAYELINTPDVAITVKGSKERSYPFLFTRTGNSYILDAGVLPAGEYSYSAKTQLGSTKYSTQGNFFIVQQQAEYRQTTANHQLLYNLAKLNNGELVYPANLDGLIDKIKKNELIKTVSYEDRRFEDLVNIKFIFFLILSLLTMEWFLRKRNGEL